MHENSVRTLLRKRATPSAPSRKGWTPVEKEFLLGEFIGERVQVAWSNRKELQGIEGTILDETYGSFQVRSGNKTRTVPKNGNVFFFPSARLKVDGKLLVCRPEERTKKLAKRL